MRTLPRLRTDMHFEKSRRSTALRQLGFLRRRLAPLFQTHFDGPSTRKATPHTAPSACWPFVTYKLSRRARLSLGPPKKNQCAVLCHKVEGGAANPHLA
jgi:hypothetical protein